MTVFSKTSLAVRRGSLVLCAAGALLTAQQAMAGSVRIYNSDSSDHTIELKCSGSSKTLKIDRSRTSTYTFHSSYSSCDIVGGSISFPTSQLKDGQSWKISQSKATKS